MEGRVVDGVAVDFADVQVGFYFGDARGEDPVGYAPDFVGGGWVRVGEGGVVGGGDQGYDAAGGGGRAAVVLAWGGLAMVTLE